MHPMHTIDDALKSVSEVFGESRPVAVLWQVIGLTMSCTTAVAPAFVNQLGSCALTSPHALFPWKIRNCFVLLHR